MDTNHAPQSARSREALARAFRPGAAQRGRGSRAWRRQLQGNFLKRLKIRCSKIDFTLTLLMPSRRPYRPNSYRKSIDFARLPENADGRGESIEGVQEYLGIKLA